MQHFAVFSDFFAVKMNQNEPRDRSRAVLSFDRLASTRIFDVEKRRRGPTVSLFVFQSLPATRKSQNGVTDRENRAYARRHEVGHRDFCTAKTLQCAA